MDDNDPAAEKPDESSASMPGPPAEPHHTNLSAELLTESDFVPERRWRLPGPGLPESLVWVVGLIILQAVGGFLALLLAFINQASEVGSEELIRQLEDPAAQQQFVQQLLQGSPVTLFCSVQVVFLFGAVLAAMVRLGRDRRHSLPMRSIPIPHVVIVGMLIVPLMLLGQSLFHYALEYWEMFVSQFPPLKALSESSSMDQIALLVPQASLPLLMFLIAFVPAVAEELVFRGVIGRGLVARWGLPAGVLITSVLFAAVHVHPVHAFALMPLAICIHLAYLSTRSFWTPMAIHFINNGSGVIALKLLGADSELADQANNGAPSLLVFISAGFLIVALTTLLWQMRVHFVHLDGTNWNPGYEGPDVPPDKLALQKQYASPDWRLLIACGICTASFVTAVVVTSIETTATAM